MRQWLVYLLVFLVIGSAPIYTSGSSGALSARARKVCGGVKPGFARCDAMIVTDSSGIMPLTNGPTQGYSPADFRAAYRVQGVASIHVAVVVAFDAPNIASDLAVFSKTFGLPVLPNCTQTAQLSCFEKLDEHGGNALPTVNAGWAIEASLDVESLHGMCPHCRISLIEASSTSINSLSAAAQQAALLGAKVVSNSYGGAEIGTETNYDPRYHHADTTMVVSSGDSGYGSNYPAASPYVVAVGGTSLHMDNGRVVGEQAWAGSGSGCSHYEAKPAWQHDAGCNARAIADISADADPATGAAIYDSYSHNGRSGWFIVGGTSLAAPLIAGIIANSGQTAHQPASLYADSSPIRDITSGLNGRCGSYICRAAIGYDGPTGLGVLDHM